MQPCKLQRFVRNSTQVVFSVLINGPVRAGSHEDYTIFVRRTKFSKIELKGECQHLDGVCPHAETKKKTLLVSNVLPGT